MRYPHNITVQNRYRVFGTLLIALLLASCSSSMSQSGKRGGEKVVVEREYPVYPDGVVDYVWEEPTREIVDVPPGLDPEGHYYRPGHQEAVETLPGRYRFYSE